MMNWLQQLAGGGQQQQPMPMDNHFAAQMAYDNAQQDRQRALQMQQPQYGGGGVSGILAGVLSMLGGKALERRADETASQALKRQFEYQNQAAQAQAEKAAADEERKFQRDLERDRKKAEEAAKNRAKTELDYLPEQDRGRAARIKAGLELGAQAPRQISYGTPVEVMGPDGKPMLVRPGSDGSMQPINGYAPRPQEREAPANYQWAGDGKLTFIPGGPADPANKGSAVGQEAQNKLALIENALANAREYAKRTIGPDGEFRDTDARLGDTAGLLTAAIQDQLYVKSGASAPVEEVKKWEGIYGPSLFERDKTASAKVMKLIADLERQKAGILGQHNGQAPGGRLQGSAGVAPSAQGGSPDYLSVLAKYSQ